VKGSENYFNLPPILPLPFSQMKIKGLGLALQNISVKLSLQGRMTLSESLLTILQGAIGSPVSSNTGLRFLSGCGKSTLSKAAFTAADRAKPDRNRLHLRKKRSQDKDISPLSALTI
jgi:hypothetical protein